MSDTSQSTEEKWEALGPNDKVIEVPLDGRVVAYFSKNRGIMIGAIVRWRNNAYMKRLGPFEILDPAYVRHLHNIKQYKLGSTFR